MKTSPHLLPTVDELKELFSYDPETGIVTRLKFVCPRAKKGALVGVATRNGYLKVCIGAAEFLLHRVVWALHYGEWPTSMLDHRNGDRRDNRPANLRLATDSENKRNSKKPKHNTSGTKGVHWDKSRCKWMASIQINGRHIHLGRFDCMEEATAAYAAGSTRLHGEFGRLA